MKKSIYFLLVSMLGIISACAAPNLVSTPADVYNGERFIFLEGGIEFSVYPDGEFDFVMPQVVNGLNINVNNGPFNISFNTGFNYDPYVQYDNYGAVIQIADVPLYYDNWGRLNQAGNVIINYNNNFLSSIGGLQIYYNGNRFSYTRGYVNVYNRRINHYPYAGYLYRPYADRCLVYTTPYRTFYTPQRYSYAYHKNHYRNGYNDGYANAYRNFNRPQGGIAHNNARPGSYREARETTSRSNNGRSNADFTRATPAPATRRSSSAYERQATPRTTVVPQTRRSADYQQNSNSAVRRSTTAASSTAQRASRNTNTQQVIAPSRSRTQAAPARASQSSRRDSQSSSRATSTESSRRSSRSSGSRSGGL